MRKSPPYPNTKLKALWDTLDKKQRERFAKASGKTVGSILHTVYGRRGISAEQAIKFERAASRMGHELSRTDLNGACRGCEFARACLGGRRGRS